MAAAASRRHRQRTVRESEGTSTAEDAYRLHASSVLGYLHGIGVAEPEDLLGEVFVQIARSIASFRGDTDQLRRWVFAVTRNCIVDDRRHRARRPVVDGPDVPDRPIDQPGGPDPELVAAIAHLTGRPVGAVKSMQHRALAQLAAQLDGEARC